MTVHKVSRVPLAAYRAVLGRYIGVIAVGGTGGFVLGTFTESVLLATIVGVVGSIMLADRIDTNGVCKRVAYAAIGAVCGFTMGMGADVTSAFSAIIGAFISCGVSYMNRTCSYIVIAFSLMLSAGIATEKSPDTAVGTVLHGPFAEVVLCVVITAAIFISRLKSRDGREVP
jgi:hypothetical protein